MSINNLRSVRINNILALTAVVATLKPKDLDTLEPETLNGLEKSLTDAAKNVNSPIPPVERQREMVADIKQNVAKKNRAPSSSAPRPTKADLVQAGTVELSMERVGDELHLRTPFWNPLNYKCREVFKGENRYDRELGVRVLPADRESEVLEVIREAFGEAKKPHHLLYGGKRIVITAGKQA